MIKLDKPLILGVDDDNEVLKIINRVLSGGGYNVKTLTSGKDLFQYMAHQKPNLILLDITMPEMDGYEICTRLQENKDFAHIPVIFVTGLGGETDKIKAFSCGAVDYVVKPFERDELLEKVEVHLETKNRWKNMEIRQVLRKRRLSNYVRFKDFLFNQLNIPSDSRLRFSDTPPHKLYDLAFDLGIPPESMARILSQFLGLEYYPKIERGSIQLGVLPTSFCMESLVVAVKKEKDQLTVVITNPFLDSVMEGLTELMGESRPFKLGLTEPDKILHFFE